MRTLITLTTLLLASNLCLAQDLYTQSFGNRKDKSIIYLHGGPGYNSVNFEATSAKQLAESGFFVIVYDRRGEGRSPDPNAKFTFEEAFEDLNAIYQKYELNNATLIGHSFGGVIATLFTETNPDKVRSIVFVGAPLSMQKTFQNIVSKSRAIYELKNDHVNLNYIAMIEKMDTASIAYSSYCFAHAMQNGFYSPKNPTAEAQKIYAGFLADTTSVKYASQSTYAAPTGFWKNEKYTTLDLTGNVQALVKNKVKIFGLYGKDDGLFSVQQVEDLEKLIGSENLKYFDNCSHNVFMDQQTAFIEAIKTWTK